MRMRFKSIGSRIVTIFLCLMLVVQIAAFFAIRESIDANAVTTTAEHLDSGEKVLGLLLEQNAVKLLHTARALVASANHANTRGRPRLPEIQEQLEQASQRVGASFALYVEPNAYRETANSALTDAMRKDVFRVIDRNRQNKIASGSVLIDGQPYQIVVASIAGRENSGWISLGFKVDARFFQTLRRVASLEITLLSIAADGAWKTELSTLSPDDSRLLEYHQRQVRALSQDSSFSIRLSQDEYNARSGLLAQSEDRKLVMVLLRSITDATSPYQTLQMTLLVLTALSILLVGLGSITAVRRITQPLRDLCVTAARLGAGDYTKHAVLDRADEIGDLSRAFASMRDGIAAREDDITRLAFWDSVTGLPNRAQFARLLEAEISQSNDSYSPFCLLMLDLDRFKHVNDALGHAFGDALLRQVGERLQANVSDSNGTVARLGNDEFAILLCGSSIDDARKIAGAILKALEVPISIDEQPVDLGAGIGISAFPAHGLTARALLSHAEMAMYAAKQSGNDAVVYDVNIDAGSEQNLTLLSDLRRAVENNEFRLFIQPKIAMGTRTAIGGEALIRWQRPDGTMVRPDQFIPFAEKSGFIRVLTRWMFEQAAILASELQARGHSLKISVNLSARDLLDRELPSRFQHILTAHNVSANTFCLEITESSIMEDPARCLHILDSLHKMGLELSIDDFGTGYSSLAYLKKLPVDELKIDQSFVMNMAQDKSDAMIVRSTIDLGHNMGLRVVAEGIESRVVWDLLRKMDCDQGQGYFMSKPMPADQFLPWLESTNSVAMLDDIVG